MGYVICRLKSSFRDWLVREFPARWGMEAEAIVYPNKGDAERIRARFGSVKTAVVDLGDEKPTPRSQHIST